VYCWCESGKINKVFQGGLPLGFWKGLDDFANIPGLGLMIGKEPGNVFKVFVLSPYEFGCNEALDGWFFNAEVSTPFDFLGFEFPELANAGLDDLQVGYVGFDFPLRIKYQPGFFDCVLKILAVEPARRLPHIEVDA